MVLRLWDGWLNVTAQAGRYGSDGGQAISGGLRVGPLEGRKPRHGGGDDVADLSLIQDALGNEMVEESGTKCASGNGSRVRIVHDCFPCGVPSPRPDAGAN